jgi:hypothetical protein
MTRRQFKAAISNLLNEPTPELSWDLKTALVRRCLIDYEKEAGFDDSKKGQAWTDDELRIILRHTPTTENGMRLARAFRRGYGSIEQIFRWAASSDDEIAAKRPEDSFICHIKTISKEIGWRAT